jgi:hypothetical protein
MSPEQNTPPPQEPQPTELFGSLPNASEGFRKVPNSSETFRSVPNHSEAFRNVRNDSERKEYCTLTVREAARLFESAGVARTERSIINWCQPNKMGVARLDNYFDPNERKYFISPQSVELAIQEEKAKAAKTNEPAEPSPAVRKASEPIQDGARVEEEGREKRVAELRREVFDLKILNSGKDQLIGHLQRERDKFFDQLLSASRKVGELETKLLQVGEPRDRITGEELPPV